MLAQTFCHIPRISPRTETQLWAAGVCSWEDALAASELPLSRMKREVAKEILAESQEHLQRGNPHFFADLLPSNLHWRLFPEFRQKIAYLDIETTGLNGSENDVTTIALYDGRRIRTYVNGQNLNSFKRDIREYSVLVTYNGKCFDIPFLRENLNMEFPQVHIDLRYVLQKLGFTGGLKGCEHKLGLDRGDLEGVDGFFAVILWSDYRRHRNERALETLLAYNVLDVVNLETLLTMAYNLRVKETPFATQLSLPLPKSPVNPFEPDRDTVNRLKGEFAWRYESQVRYV